MTTKICFSTTLHNIKAIIYPPPVLNNFNYMQVKEYTKSLRMTSETVKAFEAKSIGENTEHFHQL